MQHREGQKVPFYISARQRARQGILQFVLSPFYRKTCGLYNNSQKYLKPKHLFFLSSDASKQLVRKICSTTSTLQKIYSVHLSSLEALLILRSPRFLGLQHSVTSANRLPIGHSSRCNSKLLAQLKTGL